MLSRNLSVPLSPPSAERGEFIGIAALTPLLLDDSDDHAHHWMIARQNGPASEGTCKDCGETRDFVNGFVRSYGPKARFRASPPQAGIDPAR